MFGVLDNSFATKRTGGNAYFSVAGTSVVGGSPAAATTQQTNVKSKFSRRNAGQLSARHQGPSCLSITRATLPLLVLFLLTVHSTEAIPLQQQQQQQQQMIDETSLLAEAIQAAAAAAVASNSNSLAAAVDSSSASSEVLSPASVANSQRQQIDSVTASVLESLLSGHRRENHHNRQYGQDRTAGAASTAAPSPEESYIKRILQQPTTAGRGTKHSQNGRRANSQNKNGNANANAKSQNKGKYLSQSNANNNNMNSQQSGASGNMGNSLHYNPLTNRKIFRADPNLQRLEKKSWKIPIKSIALYSENSKDLQASQMIGDLKELFDTFKDS
jgi:hypothetical protein